MLSPHWHAQVEVNFIMRGSVHYNMAEHDISLSAGDMCLFWGGLPHQMDDALRRRHLCRRASAAGAFLPPASAERRAAAG